jgi:hypothetical protein
MREKALINLRVARALHELGFHDAAATHLYYAALQAEIHSFEKRGLRPQDLHPRSRRWDHWLLIEHAGLARGREGDRVLLRDLRSARNEADYRADGILGARVDGLLEPAAEFIREAPS